MGKLVTEANNYNSQINNWKLALSFKWSKTMVRKMQT